MFNKRINSNLDKLSKANPLASPHHQFKIDTLVNKYLFLQEAIQNNSDFSEEKIEEVLMSLEEETTKELKAITNSSDYHR